MERITENMRDLGGFYNSNLKTQYGVYIRSNNLNKLDNFTLNYLKGNNINTIIDLRTKEEILSKPSIFSNNNYFNIINIDLKHDKCPKREMDIPNGYFEIIEDKDNIKKILEILSNNNTLFHCSQGKDRTGIIAFILLLIMDIPISTILADYTLSYLYIKENIDKMHELNKKMPKFIGKSKYKYIESTYKLFINKYKNINNYLEYLNIDKNVINKIKDRFMF